MRWAALPSAFSLSGGSDDPYVFSEGGTVKLARLVGPNWPWDCSAIDHCPAYGGTVPPMLNTYDDQPYGF